MATAEPNRPHPTGSPTYETHHATDGEATLGETIIDAIATAEGVDPTDYDLELYEAVDLDALDALFERQSDDRWRFEFSVAGRLVAVEGDGRVTVFDS